MLTVNGVAEALGWSTGYIRRLCREGRLQGARRVGRDWLIPDPVTLVLPKQETTVQPLTIGEVCQAAANGDGEISAHAERRSAERRIRPSALLGALAEAEMVENYPDDARGPSALVLAYIGGRPWHAVCGRSLAGGLRIVTLYEPSMPWWNNERVRNTIGEGDAAW